MAANKNWVQAFNIPDKDLSSWNQQLPVGCSLTTWCLQNKKIPAKEYLEWAKNEYKLPLLNSNFFTKQADEKLWLSIQTVANWSGEMFPIGQWDGTIYVACLEPHPETKWSFNVCYVLANPDDMFSYWSRLQNVVAESSAPAAEPVTVAEPPAAAPVPAAAPAPAAAPTPPAPQKEPQVAQAEPDAPPPITVAPKTEATTSAPEELSTPDSFQLNVEPAPATPKIEMPSLVVPNQKPVTGTPEVPAGMTPEVPAGIAPEVPAGMAPEVPAGMTPAVPAGVTPEVPAGMAPEVPAGMAPEVPAGMAPEVPAGMTPEVPAGINSSLNEDSISSISADDTPASDLGNVAASVPTVETERPQQKEVERPAYDVNENWEPLTPEVMENIKQEMTLHAAGLDQIFEEAHTKFNSLMVLTLSKKGLRPWFHDGTWNPRHESAREIIDMSAPSIFRIVQKSLQPFHGPISSNPINDLFFKRWGYAKCPMHVTVTVIAYDSSPVALVLFTGDKNSSSMQALNFAEKVTEKLKIVLEKIQKAA